MSVADTPTAFENTALVIQVFVVPFAAYMVGIFVRNRFMPESASPSLKSLMILGLPIYLVAVCPMLMAAERSLANLDYGYLLTIGIVMEHGMIVHETAIARINQLLKEQAAGPPAAAISA
jgi:hypothetical protein